MGQGQGSRQGVGGALGYTRRANPITGTAAAQHHLIQSLTDNLQIPGSGCFGSSLWVGFGTVGLSRPEKIDLEVRYKEMQAQCCQFRPQCSREARNQLCFSPLAIKQHLKTVHHGPLKILFQLCDLGHVSSHCWASVSSCIMKVRINADSDLRN